MLKVGDVVQTNLEHAWLWRGTEHEHLMDKPRTGRVINLPWTYQNERAGTIQVRWDSLTGSDNRGPNWLTWVHSDLIIPRGRSE